jgi:YD repeat-containing protein
VTYGFGSLDGVNRFLTTRIDPNSRATRSYHDVDGNVLGVEQVNAKGNVLRTARYDYDALNQLTSSRDAKGSTTRLEYDTLGRNVVLDNPDLGRTELRYDPAGNLKAKITANLAALGQQIRYLYTFNRLDRIDYPQSSGGSPRPRQGGPGQAAPVLLGGGENSAPVLPPRNRKFPKNN